MASHANLYTVIPSKAQVWYQGPISLKFRVVNEIKLWKVAMGEERGQIFCMTKKVRGIAPSNFCVRMNFRNSKD